MQSSSQIGKRRWSKSGKIIEVLPFRQYRIRVDGSDRITIRNRRFLKCIPTPVKNYYIPSPDLLDTRQTKSDME